MNYCLHEEKLRDVQNRDLYYRIRVTQDDHYSAQPPDSLQSHLLSHKSLIFLHLFIPL